MRIRRIVRRVGREGTVADVGSQPGTSRGAVVGLIVDDRRKSIRVEWLMGGGGVGLTQTGRRIGRVADARLDSGEGRAARVVGTVVRVLKGGGDGGKLDF